MQALGVAKFLNQAKCFEIIALRTLITNVMKFSEKSYRKVALTWTHARFVRFLGTFVVLTFPSYIIRFSSFANPMTTRIR